MRDLLKTRPRRVKLTSAQAPATAAQLTDRTRAEAAQVCLGTLRARRLAVLAGTALGLAAVLGLPGPAVGGWRQPEAEIPAEGLSEGLADQPPPAGEIDPLNISGRAFGDLRLPGAAERGPIRLAARQATRWREPGPPLPDGTPGPATSRLLLEGDVRVRLGDYEFQSRRALIWLAPVSSAGGADSPPASAAEPSSATADPGLFAGSAQSWQVFVYFDRVGNPTEDAAVSVAGDRLAVDALLTPPEGIELRSDRALAGRPAERFVLEGEVALARHLRRLVTGRAQPLAAPLQPGQRVEVAPGSLTAAGRRRDDPTSLPADLTRWDLDAARAQVEARLPPALDDGPIFAADGVFTFSVGTPDRPGRIELIRDEAENAVILTGGVVVQYTELARPRSLELTAERVVLFVEPGAWAQTGELGVRAIRGLYAEGDVLADDGTYTIRAPRIYYDIEAARALVLDAVFWTYDRRRGMPIYVRAEAVRRESQELFTARHARVSNSAFFEPHLSIGARDVTLYRSPLGGENRQLVDARHVTLNAGPLPFFYWPLLRGDPTDVPLREVRVQAGGGSGAAIGTSWNLWSLIGVEPPAGSSFEVLADYYFERGPALGAEINWADPRGGGGLFGYALPADSGRDTLVTGRKRDRDEEFRGLITIEHQFRFAQRWALFAEAASISDATFIDAFFRQQARERREFTNSAYLRRTDENTALWLGARSSLDDSIFNDSLRQTPGYTVDKLPEARYVRLADDVLPAVGPGLLTYSSEYRATRMRLRFWEDRPDDIGFDSTPLASEAFGAAPGQSIASLLRSQGYSEGTVGRFDTRQELSSQLTAGPVAITPFAVGRFTAYSDDFREFRGERESSRLWGSAGVRATTSLQRVDNSVESRLLDLHRIRHVVTPSASVWLAGANIEARDLPIYDPDVEPLATGTVTRLAIDQVWQTQRGGPGRWRSEDVFTLSADAVISSDDTNRASPIGRYFDYRPELSQLGDYSTVDAVWKVSQAVALSGQTIFDYADMQPARTVVGGSVQHTPEFSTAAELRFLNAQDQTYLNVGAQYRLTPQYQLGAAAAYNTNRGDFQTFSAEVRRLFPNVWLGVSLGYDTVTDETTLGFLLQPVGIGAGSGRVQSRDQRP